MVRLVRRAREKLRDRGDMNAAAAARMPLQAGATRYMYGGGGGGVHSATASGSSGASAGMMHAHAHAHTPRAPRDGKTLIRFAWAGGACKNICIVASFDGFMHHRMNRIALGQRSGPATHEASLRISPGTHTYKFLVDGGWRTCMKSSPTHPIHQLPDGTMAHQLNVEQDVNTMPLPHSAPVSIASSKDDIQSVQSPFAPQLPSRSKRGNNHQMRTPSPSPMVRSPTRGRAPVRSSSVSDLHRVANDPRLSAGSTRAGMQHGVELGSQRSFTSLHSQTRERKQREQMEHAAAVAAAAADRHDRPSSFMAMAPSPSQRKSLLPRLGSGWMRRLSGRHHSNISEAMENSGEASGSAAGAGGARLELATPEKENSSSLANPTSFSSNGSSLTPRKWRPGLRASARAAPVTISQPMCVDQPADQNEVAQTANNWRSMALELQNNLNDPNGARELLFKAVKHREEHGLGFTLENAQTHVDLARNLSKADRLSDAEDHLRLALRIYHKINSGPEHIGDLLHYIGVVVDRQKKRKEAEALYRQALTVYRENRLTGNNVDIALKNLALNLRKQGREEEWEIFVGQYCNPHGHGVAVS